MDRKILKEAIKANKIALTAVIISLFIGIGTMICTIRSLHLYRTVLELQYSPIIYPTIMGEEANPFLVIYNLGKETTEICDYNISFLNEAGKIYSLSDEDLFSTTLKEEIISTERPIIRYFKSKDGKYKVHKLLSGDYNIILCEGIFKVKNRLKSKEIKEFSFRCKRSNRTNNPEQTRIWWNTGELR